MVDSSFQYLSQDNQFTSLSVIKDQSRFGWENEAAHSIIILLLGVRPKDEISHTKRHACRQISAGARHADKKPRINFIIICCCESGNSILIERKSASLSLGPPADWLTP